jgi:ubiquinone biosynthesis protein
MEKKPSREAVKRRQLQIEQCLAEYGLAQQPRHPLRRASAADDEGRWRRLSAALVSLGPVFSFFGIYLSSRADMLPAKNCLELAAIPDRAEASPINSIRGLIGRELGREPSEAYAVFDEEPFESRLIFQSHRAQLRSGEAVTVKVLHPELEEYLACDLELLSLLDGVSAGFSIESAVEDFRCALKQQTDFLREAEMTAEFAGDTVRLEAIKVPLVYRDFCTSKVLTVEHLSGTNLDDLISPFSEWESEAGRATNRSASDLDSYETASRLSLVWLRLALRGRVFPVDPRPENILLLPDRQLAFTGGSFASLTAEVKTNLFDYLIASVTQDPDRACSRLLGEMKRVRGAASEDELRHRLRQVVPFRDGGWSNSGDSRSLAEYLFVHWRLAREYGYRPQPHLLSFCRGLFQVAATARRLAPNRDLLLEGLQDLRLNMVFAQFREMMSLGQLGDSVDRYAALMTELPERLDDALTLAAGGHIRLKPEKTERAAPRSRRNSSAVVFALLLLMTAVALWSHHLSASTGAKVWVERVGAVAFLLLGALLLRAACRMS